MGKAHRWWTGTQVSTLTFYLFVSEALLGGGHIKTPKKMLDLNSETLV